jgi:hypothetical protein
MYFAQFFCGVNKKTYPFESTIWRHSPLGMNSIGKFLVFILHAYVSFLLSFSFFMVYFSLCSFNIII